MLEDRRAQKERRDPNRMQRRDFGKVKRWLRNKCLKRDTGLFAFAGSDKGNRALMCRLRCVRMKTFMELRRDGETDG